MKKTALAKMLLGLSIVNVVSKIAMTMLGVLVPTQNDLASEMLDLLDKHPMNGGNDDDPIEDNKAFVDARELTFSIGAAVDVAVVAGVFLWLKHLGLDYWGDAFIILCYAIASYACAYFAKSNAASIALATRLLRQESPDDEAVEEDKTDKSKEV